MNAWVITWEWHGDHAAVEDPLVAILSSRKGSAWMAKYIENLYLSFSSTAQEMAYYANRQKMIPYKAKDPMSMNWILHGNRIICGNNPELYGRKVTGLEIMEDDENDLEIVRWKEPPCYRTKDNGELEIASEGDWTTIKRKGRTLLKTQPKKNA